LNAERHLRLLIDDDQLAVLRREYFELCIAHIESVLRFGNKVGCLLGATGLDALSRSAGEPLACEAYAFDTQNRRMNNEKTGINLIQEFWP